MATTQPQQPFGYDPTQYVTQAGQWANNMWGTGQTQYGWAGNQFNKNAGTADLVTGAALKNAGVFDDAANAGVSRYENLYAPAMKQQLDYAQQYASPENLALARGQAVAGVGQAFDAQAKAAADSLQSYDIDPGAIAARLDATVRTQRAAAQAGAGTQSDINRQLVGQQLLGQAINTGQTDVGIAGQQAGIAAANRNQAVNTGLATTASGASTMGTAPQWAQMGATQLQQWPKAELDSLHASNEQGGLWNDINRTTNQAQQFASQQGSGFGAAAGAGLGALSSMVKFAPIALAEGGVVPQLQDGGAAPGVTPGVTAIQTGSVVPPTASVPGIQGPDKVPAMVEAGEGIIPKPVMDYIGQQGFQAFLQKNFKAMGLGPQPPAQGKQKPVPPQAVQTGPTFASQGALA
jgi:hypothetical protein